MTSRLAQLLSMAFVQAAIAVSAHAATPEQVERFGALLKSRVSTPEAIEAARDTPPGEYARWGEEVCNWVRIGKADFPATQPNLAAFFGDDLSAAIVYAARQVMCPELK
jgi:hypothetical protein